MNPLVSVIIPVYKVEQYIHRCLKSVLNQTYTNLEIILVDDGSPDNCPKICDEYAQKDSRIKVIHKKNGGASEARNVGIDTAKGEFLVFVDSDDFIQPSMIQHLYELQERFDADLVQCGRVLGCDNAFPDVNHVGTEAIHKYNNVSIFESSDNNVTFWAKLYKKGIWDNVRLPVGKENEDDYTVWKVYYNAKKIIVTSYKFYYNFRNPAGLSSNLAKDPKIQYPIEAYHERIAYFDGINEKHLSDLSKWRYVRYLLLSYINPNLTKEQRATLYSEFKLMYKSVLGCSSVNIAEKTLILLYRISPKLTSDISVKLRDLKRKCYK